MVHTYNCSSHLTFLGLSKIVVEAEDFGLRPAHTTEPELPSYELRVPRFKPITVASRRLVGTAVGLARRAVATPAFRMAPTQATLGYVKSSQTTLGCDFRVPLHEGKTKD